MSLSMTRKPFLAITRLPVVPLAKSRAEGTTQPWYPALHPGFFGGEPSQGSPRPSREETPAVKAANAVAKILKKKGVEFLIGYPVNQIIEAGPAAARGARHAGRQQGGRGPGGRAAAGHLRRSGRALRARVEAAPRAGRAAGGAGDDVAAGQERVPREPPALARFRRPLDQQA